MDTHPGPTPSFTRPTTALGDGRPGRYAVARHLSFRMVGPLAAAGEPQYSDTDRPVDFLPTILRPQRTESAGV